MYYFLGIITKTKLKRGIFEPDYALFTNHSSDEDSSGLLVGKYRPEKQVRNLLLLTSITGNETFIEYMNSVRVINVKRKPGGKSFTTHRHMLRGSMFLCPCDRYGHYKYPLIYVRDVPAPAKADTGFMRALVVEEASKQLNVVLSASNKLELLTFSAIKPRLIQSPTVREKSTQESQLIKKERENGTEKRRRKRKRDPRDQQRSFSKASID
jgi:hypothetical protein